MTHDLLHHLKSFAILYTIKQTLSDIFVLVLQMVSYNPSTNLHSFAVNKWLFIVFKYMSVKLLREKSQSTSKLVASCLAESHHHSVDYFPKTITLPIIISTSYL